MISNHRIHEIALTSGARLVHVSIPDLPMSEVAVWFRAGSRFDPRGKEGTAHFFEHLLMMRTKRWPNKEERLRFLESHGISYNAYTTKESAHYYTIQLPEQTITALELLVEGMSNSIITEEDVEREKDVISNEELENRNSPNEYIWQLGDQGLWPNSSLGRSLWGSSKTIRGITVEDLGSFQKQYYQPGNAIFVVVSNEDPKKIEDTINKALALKGSTLVIQKESFVSPQQFISEKRDSSQVAVALNFRTDNQGGREEAILHFIRDYMANTWISRLNHVLRVQNGMTYWVRGESAEFYDTGYLRFIFSVDPEKVDQSIELALKEISHLKKELLSEDDLRDYKTSFISNFIRLNLTPGDVGYWYGWLAMLQEPLISFEDYIQKVNSITAEQIRDTAKEVFTQENMSVALLGPVEKGPMDLSEL